MNKALLSLLVLLAVVTHTQARQPNVILIYTDDQGTIDVNCYGAKDLTTPHMDGLAKRGVKFTQFYSAAPVCSPSRAAVITGRYPQRAQIPGNVSSAHGHAGMPESQITMAEVFRKAGYATAHIGKWHLGYDQATMPNNQGSTIHLGTWEDASTTTRTSSTGMARTAMIYGKTVMKFGGMESIFPN